MIFIIKVTCYTENSLPGIADFSGLYKTNGTPETLETPNDLITGNIGNLGSPCRGAYFRYPSRYSSVTSSSLLDFTLVLVLVRPNFK